MVPLPSHLRKMAVFSLVNALTSEEKGQRFLGVAALGCWLNSGFSDLTLGLAMRMK